MDSDRPSKRSNPHNNNSHKKHRNNNTKNWSQKKSKREKNITEGSSEDVLRLDIEALVASKKGSVDEVPQTTEGDGDASPSVSLPEEGSETEVEILELSSTGDGLGMREGSLQVYVVPFAVPGDTVKVKVFKHMTDKHHTIADFISITKPSPLRDDSRIKCQYFGKCGGCQFQMLEYPEQLKLKKRVLEKAFANFANIAPELIPAIGDTIGSPLQYDYRTKLTPHFDGPRELATAGGITTSPRRHSPSVPPLVLC